MFIGEYKHTIDNKNRVTIPSKYRDGLGDIFMLTKGLDNCLSIYPYSEWTIFEQKLKSLPLTNQNARRFTRFFLSGAVECNIDKQGRILLTPSLKSYADVTKDIYFIGMGDRIEIWSSAEWDKYNENDFDANELAEQMAELGI
ncbi:MAG TPA: division/cell wall cluster transcriptional repressor MraZ [Epulopiscium sp.]|nr:division/cell wall cluster transcriptional repressor MraZ [Candidatus Epulonipiscium sp.]